MFAVLFCLALLAPPPADDLVPAAIDALLAEPDDDIFFGIPPMLDAVPLGEVADVGQVRSLVDLGDVTGDGAPDVAVGYGPDLSPKTLEVRDGATAALLWDGTPGGGGFRSMRGLSARDGRLALGVTSGRGRVECRDGASGAVHWSRDIASQSLPGRANVLAVEFVDDLSGDGVDDVLVAGGHRIDGALLLCGANGSTLWKHDAGDVVYDARVAHDEDGDGLPDVAIVGGEGAPFAKLLSSQDGTVLWTEPLDGAGSVVLPMDDVDDDGTPDLAVGQFNAPGPCLLALSGDDGGRLWEALGIFNDVTALVLVDDMLGTGLRDVCVGSFDNAINGVLALNGLVQWRREATTNNGGMMLPVDSLGDIDGNGTVDVFTVSVDHRVYVMGGVNGQFMAGWDLGSRGAAVLALGDGDGDGRPELVVGGNRALTILDGNAGLADGPFIVVTPPQQLQDETRIEVFAYPTTGLILFLAAGDASIPLPAWGGVLGLDPALMFPLFTGIAPGAGSSGFILSAFPPEAIGLVLYTQAVTIFGPGHGLLSNTESFEIVP